MNRSRPGCFDRARLEPRGPVQSLIAEQRDAEDETQKPRCGAGHHQERAKAGMPPPGHLLAGPHQEPCEQRRQRDDARVDAERLQAAVADEPVLQEQAAGDRQRRAGAQQNADQTVHEEVHAGEAERHVDEGDDEKRGGQEGDAWHFVVADAPKAQRDESCRDAVPAQPPRRRQDAVADVHSPEHDYFLASTWIHMVSRWRSGYSLPPFSIVPPSRWAVKLHQPGSGNAKVKMPLGSKRVLNVISSSSGISSGGAGLHGAISRLADTT